MTVLYIQLIYLVPGLSKLYYHSTTLSASLVV